MKPEDQAGEIEPFQREIEATFPFLNGTINKPDWFARVIWGAAFENLDSKESTERHYFLEQPGLFSFKGNYFELTLRHWFDLEIQRTWPDVVEIRLQVEIEIPVPGPDDTESLFESQCWAQLIVDADEPAAVRGVELALPRRGLDGPALLWAMHNLHTSVKRLYAWLNDRENAAGENDDSENGDL